MSYRLRTLGSIRILGDDGSEVQLRSAKHTALFVFLNAERRRTRLRSELCEYFWTTGVKRARHSLSQALYDIRSRVGPVIESGGSDTVSLDAPGAWYDVEELHERMARGECGAAAGLYRGPFAVELDEVGTDEFEYWLETERRRIQVTGRNAYRRHIEELEEEGRWNELSDVARRFLRHAPEDVDAHRAFVRSLWLSGDRASALEYAASLEERRPELAEQIRPLVDHIEGRSTGRVKETPEPREPPMIGREQELSSLRRLSDRLAQPTVAHVRGEAGIGKTRLVRELGMALDLDGFRLVRSRCWEAESDVPYAAVAEGLERWLGTGGEAAAPAGEEDLGLARSALFPDSGDPPTLADDRAALSELRRRVFEEVTQFVRRLVGRRPTLWVVEDIQWIDSTSSALLHYLLRRLSDVPLLLIFTSRSSSRRADGLTRYLNRSDKAESIDLGPLDLEATHRLLEEASDGPLPERVRDRMAELCGGNPYFALELLRAHRERGELEAGEEADPLGSGIVDERLERVLRERLRGVSVDGLKVLEALAVLGGNARWDLVLSLARVDVEDPSWVCDRLCQYGLLETGEGTVAFAHDVLRELIYGDLGAIRRYSLHQMAAEALARSGEASRGVLAEHFHLGGDPARAFHYATAAARDAESRGAHLEAARYADRALAASTGESPREEVELRRLAARAYSSAGELVKAARRLEPLLQGSDADRTEEEIRAVLELAEIQVEQAAEDAAREILVRAKNAIEASEPGTSTSRLEPVVLSTELRLEIHFGDRSSIDEAGDRLKSVVEKAGSVNGGRNGRVDLALAAYLAFFESAEKARRLLQEVRSQDLPPRLQLRATMLLGNVELRATNWDRAEYLFRNGETSADQRTDVWLTGQFRNNLGCVYLEQGQWRESQTLFDESLELYASLPRQAHDRLRPAINKANVALYRLKSQEARQQYSEIINLAKTADIRKFGAEARSCLGLLSLQQGDRRAAERQYRKVRDLVDDRSLSQEGFKVDWFAAFVGDGESPPAELRERARSYRDTDTLSFLKLRWLAEVADKGSEQDPELRDELRERGLLWFEKFAERWARMFRANRTTG